MACSNHPTSEEITEAVAVVQVFIWNIMQSYIVGGKQTDASATGTFAEFVAMVHKPGSIDLNNYKSSFPVIDNISTQAASSVKMRSDITKYPREFRKAIGTLEPEKFDKAAQVLFSGRNVLPVPQEILRAHSVQEVKSYLTHNVQMQVPREHVEPVKDALRSSIAQRPHLYNLSISEARQPAVVEAIVARIVPIS